MILMVQISVVIHGNYVSLSWIPSARLGSGKIWIQVADTDTGLMIIGRDGIFFLCLLQARWNMISVTRSQVAQPLKAQTRRVAVCRASKQDQVGLAWKLVHINMGGTGRKARTTRGTP